MTIVFIGTLGEAVKKQVPEMFDLIDFLFIWNIPEIAKLKQTPLIILKLLLSGRSAN
jgi:hypothetical protein